MEAVKVFPILKDYIWGGNRLEAYGIEEAKNAKVAEAWVLSFLKGNESVLDDGTPLASVATREDFGSACDKFLDFPILIKLIDAADDLSVQVHPDDAYARANENSFGKTEMWYIVDSKKDAGLYMGFKRKVTREEVEKALADGTVTDLLNFVNVKKGDYFFIPPGTVHAIGKGCLICEVQQSSNITYRLFDYNRKDAFGNKRELHVKKSLDVAILDVAKNTPSKDGMLCECEYFAVEHKLGANRIFRKNSFTAIVVISGEGLVNGIPAKKGDCYFIPAGKAVDVLGDNLELIEAFVP